MPPAAPQTQVLRQDLCDKVSGSAASIRLVLLCAPAGFGKTTAMLQIEARLTSQGVETAWLTLDAADNDATRFLRALDAAIGSLGSKARDDGAPRYGALETLYSRSGPFAVFLDNFEVIHDAAALALLRATIERLPTGGRLVIGSRTLPELGLARLRAHGHLLEVDSDMMRFRLDETEQYFRLRRLPDLTFDAVARLQEKTEGWITALWLASTALEREGSGSDFVERFSGSNRSIADYLAEDVLAHQSEEVREFLLRTSILRRLDAGVCRALAPRSDAGRILPDLEAQNLFLVPLAHDRGSYRYHRLFADYLRARLLREHPDELPRLHLVAAGWYESHGEAVPAIDHAIDGGDFPYALSLLQRHAQRFLEQGRMRMLARWFAAMPAHDLSAYALLQAISIWATLFTHGPWQAAAELERSACAASADPQVLAHVNAQRPLLLAMQDRYDEAYAEGPSSLARLPTCNTFADSVLCNAMANVYSVMGNNAEAHRLIELARQAQGDSSFNRMYAESLEGMLDLQGGRLHQASARFRVAVSATHKASADHTSGNAWAGLLHAAVVYETNDLERADYLASIYLPLAAEVGLPDHLISGYRIRARIAFCRGESVRAFEALSELEALGHRRRLPRVVASAKLERARLLLMMGNAEASREELDRADDPAVWQRLTTQWLPAQTLDSPVLGRIRWQIHFGDARATLPALERELTESVHRSLHRRALRLRVMQSLALQRAGEPAAATEALAAALRHACREGFVRIVVDEGEAVGRLVQRFYALLLEAPARSSDRVLVAYLQRVIDAFGPLANEAVGAATANRLMEPMTRKEIQVLQLVAEGCSNCDIAGRLGLSDSTVRTHLRSINNKLGARSRAEAVAIARRLDVIR